MTDEQPTITNALDGQATTIPENIREQTEALLGTHPITNQALVLENARWFYVSGGNCALYRYHVHYLDVLEHDDVRQRVEIYNDAREQARDIGLAL
jgi:hypothetical protein